MQQVRVRFDGAVVRQWSGMHERVGTECNLNI